MDRGEGPPLSPPQLSKAIKTSSMTSHLFNNTMALTGWSPPALGSSYFPCCGLCFPLITHPVSGSFCLRAWVPHGAGLHTVVAEGLWGLGLNARHPTAKVAAFGVQEHACSLLGPALPHCLCRARLAGPLSPVHAWGGTSLLSLLRCPQSPQLFVLRWLLQPHVAAGPLSFWDSLKVTLIPR